jgi:excinuclease ABC subunit C
MGPERDRRDLLAGIPSRPGVYLMKDASGAVFYVGKAKDLRKRLQQYLTGHDDRFFVQILDHLLADVEVYVTGNELEALVLENQLVKDLQPRHNVMLKDDKNFLRVRIDLSHPFPRIEVARRRKDDGARMFGPFLSARTIRQVVRLLNRSFHLRTCTERGFARRDRPCLRHQMHLCDAPCVKPVDAQEYRGRVDDVILFLSGRRKELQRRLARQMREASEAMNYEDAMLARDMLQGIERLFHDQAVDLHDDANIDAFGLERREAQAVVFVAQVRGGLTLNGYEYQLRDLGPMPDDELVTQVVQRHYDGQEELPREVLLTVEPGAGRGALEAWLKERAGRAVPLRVPQRGARKDLLVWSTRNATTRLDEATRVEDRRFAELSELKAALGLDALPRSIEGYDISTFHGDLAFGSQVVFHDGLPDKARYRLYRIRSVEGTDDYAMLQEVLRRRLARAAEEPLPDLMLVDGGKGQLAAARAVVEELGVDATLIGLAKDRVRAAARSDKLERSGERLVWGEPAREQALEEGSGVWTLLSRIRDEAHRFAITAHRRRRTARGLEGVLDAVPGIGRARKRELLLRYATIERMREALDAAGWKLKGYPAKTMEALKKALG